MINAETIREELRNRVSEKIDLDSAGEGRFVVVTPFRFEDGDHYHIVLKRDGNDWVLTDEASTMMHLSYWTDTDALESGNRKQIIDNSLATFAVEYRDGELFIPVYQNRFADALFDFVQAVAKVTDISFLNREFVRSTFMEDLKAFFREKVPEDRIQFNWRDERDIGSKYPVDIRINHLRRPLFVYGIPNEDKLNVATISLLTFEKWGSKFTSLGVFEEQEEINRKSLARFLDVVGKSFSSLNENKERLGSYIDEILQGAE